MSWRPKGWTNPRQKEIPGYICDYEAYRQAFEAGADAMLEALRSMGNHYSNLPECCRIIYDVAWHGGSGTTLFIPYEDKDATNLGTT